MNPNDIQLYYTYQEILDGSSVEDISLPRYPHDVEMSSDWFTGLIEARGLEFAVYTLSEFFPDDLLNQIVNAVMGVVYNRHASDFIAWVDQTSDPSYDISAATHQALSKLIGVLDLTIPKYVPMLQQTEIASTAPVTPNVDEYSEEASGNTADSYSGENSSESENKTRTNDTPQNGGDYDDDPHATNVSESTNTIGNEASSSNEGEYSSTKKSSNSVNVGTLMSRLSEMYSNFRSVVLEWSNEFNQLFLKEEEL